MKCQKCFVATANSSIVLPGKDETMSLCQACNQAMTDAARREVLDRLERQAPYPGEKVIYQPIELEECATWRQLRPDSKDRVDLMTRIVRESGLPKSDTYGHSTYLDVGCNTGYFCHQMRRLGFYAEGVDVVEGDIEVARQLDSFFRKDHNNYVIADAYNYLRDTQDRHIDVTSAFAVFQWLMIQTSIERGIECLKWLFAKTNRVCFLEMGYASEAQYKDKLPENIDRTWVWQKMEQLGEFAEIRMYDAKKHGLMFGTRDLFVGIKLPKPEHG